MMCGGRGRGQRHVGNVFSEMHNSECGPTVMKYAGVQGCLKSVDLTWIFCGLELGRQAIRAIRSHLVGK